MELKLGTYRVNSSTNLVKACLLAQLLSLLLALCGTTSEVLANHQISIPTSQSFFNYCLVAITCSAVHFFQNNRSFSLSNRWYLYLGLAILDVEGNVLVIKAYQYTSLTSVTLLDCMTIPAVMILSYFVLRSRYLSGHYIGALLCTLGLVLLVLTDGSSETGGSNPLLGDALVIAGACVYAICNVAQERLLVDKTSQWELLGMVATFAAVISGVQAAVLEREAWWQAQWGPQPILALIGFTLVLYAFYVLLPKVLVWGSATVLNLSLLTSDLWAAGARVVFFGGFGGTGWAFTLALLAETVGISVYAWSGDTHHGQAAPSAAAKLPTWDAAPAPRRRDLQGNLQEEGEGDRLLGGSSEDVEQGNASHIPVLVASSHSLVPSRKLKASMHMHNGLPESQSLLQHHEPREDLELSSSSEFGKH